MRTLIILTLCASLAWTSLRLADVERQRYAMLAGMCQLEPQSARALLDMLDCVETAEPRTSWLWNLWYGLVG
jgi:hypothetical protein